METLAIQLLMQLIAQSQKVAQAIATARAEGRELTEAELDALVRDNDVARNELQVAINNARNAQLGS